MPEEPYLVRWVDPPDADGLMRSARFPTLEGAMERVRLLWERDRCPAEVVMEVVVHRSPPPAD